MPSSFWLPLLLAGAAGGTPLVAAGPAARPAAASTQPASDGGGSATGGGELRRFNVVIDAGHGGSNLGTAGVLKGTWEKRLTLALARKLREHLTSRPEINVVLCRDDDVFMTIRARVRCARQAAAQLFVSLHANAVPPGKQPGSQHGFELYVLPPADIEDEAVAAALAEVDAADGAWAAHVVHGAASGSARAARRVQLRLAETLGAAADRGIRQTGASLDVLRGVNAPAVLVELGYLDHTGDAALLSSPEGQDKVAAALARAVIDLASGSSAGGEPSGGGRARAGGAAVPAAAPAARTPASRPVTPREPP